jgi:hexosaminidase
MVYTFYLSADDGAVIWIDGQVVVDNDGTHATEEKEGKIALKKGSHVFKLAYIQDISDKSLKLEYSVSAQEKKPVPPSWWEH